jgi:hypothetical protein
MAMWAQIHNNVWNIGDDTSLTQEMSESQNICMVDIRINNKYAKHW